MLNSRREFLTQSGAGFASVGLSALLADELRAATPRRVAEQLGNKLRTARRGDDGTIDLDHRVGRAACRTDNPVRFRRNTDRIVRATGRIGDQGRTIKPRWSRPAVCNVNRAAE